MSFLSGIFSRTKSVDDFLDKDNGHLSKIGSWIGNQQFTEEEKAKMVQAVAISVRDFSVATAKESTVRSATRRNLAIMWLTVHLFLIVSSFIAAWFNHQEFDRLWQIVTSDVLFYGTMGVMIYFFGAYGIGAHVMGKK